MNRKTQQSILALGKEIKDSELVSTSLMLSKLNKYASAYPEDKTINSLKIVFSNLENNRKGFITRKSLRDLYNKHYTITTNFASLFGDELGEKQITKEASIERFEQKPLNLSNYKVDQSIYNIVNSLVSEAKSTTDHTLIKRAETKLSQDLNFIDFKASNVKVIDSNSEMLLAIASFITPKGNTDIYIPLDKSLRSEIFIGNNHVGDLNKESIANYVQNNLGSRLKLGSKQVINTITSYFKPEDSKTELAITSLKISKAQSSVGYGGILAYELPKNEVTVIELPKSNEFSSLEEKFASPVGLALETFGDKLLTKAAKVLESTLNQANCSPAKIAIASSTDKSISFNVLSKSGKAFVVPVKIANKNALSPEIALVNGSIRKIDNSLEASLHLNDLDKKSFASVSNLSLMNSEQLISFAKTLVQSKELDKLEIVLEAIKEKDLNLYKNAYKFILSDSLVKEANVKTTKCSRLINSKNSMYKVCSHTGLPENKIYIDGLGQCRPLHSKDIVAETGFYSTAKILG